MKTVKAIYMVLAALVAGIAAGRAQGVVREASPLHFEVTEWDFGEIREEGGNVSHVFEFTNTGKIPVAIDNVTTSCGCTTPEYPREPIHPGGSGRIVATFDPVGYPGDFSKSIAVVSGGRRYTDFLTIKGHVIPRPKSIEEEYPHDMGGGMRVGSTLAAFRTIPQGGSASMVVKYVNTSAEAVTIAMEPIETSGLLDVHAPETVCAGCRGDITLTYDLSGRGGYGMMHDVLRMVVDGEPAQRTIYAAMTGIDDFGSVDVNTAPRFFLDAQSHDFGGVRRRTMPYTHRLVASNEGEEVLHIRSVGESAGFRTTLRAGMTIAPGAKLPFELLFYTGEYFPGKVNASVTVVVDDPLRPVREIRIAADIK